MYICDFLAALPISNRISFAARPSGVCFWPTNFFFGLSVGSDHGCLYALTTRVQSTGTLTEHAISAVLAGVTSAIEI